MWHRQDEKTEDLSGSERQTDRESEREAERQRASRGRVSCGFPGRAAAESECAGARRVSSFPASSHAHSKQPLTARPPIHTPILPLFFPTQSHFKFCSVKCTGWGLPVVFAVFILFFGMNFSAFSIGFSSTPVGWHGPLPPTRLGARRARLPGHSAAAALWRRP